MPDNRETDFESDIGSLEQRVFARQHRAKREPLTPWVFNEEPHRRSDALRQLPQKIRSYFS